jgi:hypothetical protein
MLGGVLGVRLDDLRIRWLQVLSSRWLDSHDGLIHTAIAAVAILERRLAVDICCAVHSDESCVCLFVGLSRSSTIVACV